jgi:two-component system heavy metal sensor histidine kinase CusS
VIRSLRAVLLLWTTAGICSVVLLVGVILFFMLRSVLFEEFDRSLLESALALATCVEQENEEVLLELVGPDMHEFERAKRPAYLQLWLGDGTEIYRSPSLRDANLARVAGSRESPAYWSLTLPNGRHGRAIGVTFTPRNENEEVRVQSARKTRVPALASSTRVTLVLARDSAEVDAPQARIGFVLGCVGLFSMAVFLGLLWLTIRRSLQPLSRVAMEIGRLDAQALSTRLDQSGAPLEIRPVIDRLNDLLHRLEGAFLRERTLTADVAHELRTPVAGIRSTIEVALSMPRRPGEYEAVLRDCLDITVKMQALVENLLSLARIEAGDVQIEMSPVLPGDMLRSAWRIHENAARSRALRVEWSLDPVAAVMTDSALLEVVIRNVLENAVEYTNERGVVKIATEADPEKVTIRVSNTGSKLSQQEGSRVFDRFWRGDKARGSSCTHFGVGMVLVKKILAVLGGGVEVRSEAGGTFEVTLFLPREVPSG